MTVRLQIPRSFPYTSIDETHVLTIDNGGLGTSGFIVLNGPYQNSVYDTFKITSLAITGGSGAAAGSERAFRLNNSSASEIAYVNYDGFAYMPSVEAVNGITGDFLSGTGTRLITSSSTGVFGNDTLISGNYDFSGTMTFGTYTGQSSIVTVGTITTGVWQGTSITTTYTDAKIKTVTGTSNRLTIGGTSTDPTFDISTSYVGQTTITTLGTITTGVWSGTTIGVSKGGTGVTTLALNGVLYGNAATSVLALAVNASATRKFLSQTSSAAPAWNTVDAGELVGATLASNVLASSLTSVGTLAALTVTATIAGSISGNAATVTTNANLTGPITSVGNATSVASQTGTGSTFVMSASPTGTGTWALPAVTVASTLDVTGVTTIGAALNVNFTNAAVNVGVNSGSASLNLSGAAASAKTLGFQTNSVNRFIFRTINNETGSDAGSDLTIQTRTDAGGSLDTPLTITRVAGGNFAIARPVTMSTTLAVTGVVTLTALTASQAVFADASKNLVSNAITGSGNVVMSASPTLTGTLGAASATFSGSVAVGTTFVVTGASDLTGNVGIGGASTSNVGLQIVSAALATNVQYGMIVGAIATSAATVETDGIYAFAKTAAAAFTCTLARSIAIEGPIKGAGSTITTAIGLDILAVTTGGTNYALRTSTGIVSFGDEVKLSSANTVNASVLATVTNKIKVNVGGTDYYLLANTSNS